MYHVQTIEEKVNNSDYAEPDLIALNTDKDDHIRYNGQLAENEDKDKEYIIRKSTVVSLW